MLDAHIPLIFNNIATEKEESRRVDRCLAFRQKNPNQNKTQQTTPKHSKTHQGGMIHYVNSSGVSTTDLVEQWFSDMAQVVESVSRIALCQFSTGQF